MSSEKTPVSILQETLLRQGIVPFYDLVQSGVGTHQGIFTYQITAGEITATGSGRSKKEAKHEAAKIALQQMKVVIEEISSEDMLKLHVASPYEASVKDNAVGTLGDICATHELPCPLYNLIREDGPPHAKQFIFACQVSTMEETAQGRTKKQAKQMAALNMLYHLTDLKLIDDTVFHADGKSLVEGYVNETPQQKTPIGLKINELSRLLQGLWTGEQLTKLRALEMPHKQPRESLAEICKELDLEYVWDYNFRDCGAASGVTLILLTKPPAIFYANPPSEQEAAASLALRYLLIMTWDGESGIEGLLQTLNVSRVGSSLPVSGVNKLVVG